MGNQNSSQLTNKKSSHESSSSSSNPSKSSRHKKTSSLSQLEYRDILTRNNLENLNLNNNSNNNHTSVTSKTSNPNDDFKSSTPNLTNKVDFLVINEPHKSSSTSSLTATAASSRNRSQTESSIISNLRKHIHLINANKAADCEQQQRPRSRTSWIGLSSRGRKRDKDYTPTVSNTATPASNSSANSSRSSSSSVLNILSNTLTNYKSKVASGKPKKSDLDDYFVISSSSGNTKGLADSKTKSNSVHFRTPPLPRHHLLHHQPRQSSLDTIENIMLKPKTNPIYDDYVITKQVLGLGISGKVLCCTHKQTGIKYALKTLKETPKAKREIDLQFRACQGCQYIVQIKDVYENIINTQRVLLIVMEIMEGGELFAKISERTKPFTEQEVAKIMHQICSAVGHLHHLGIAHRDLKPENLLLSTNDERAIIKLTDFGFAKEVTQGLQTPCYTPYYVAPEVLGSEKYDASCDIWSLGVIMYILCCGYPPFYSRNGQPISPGMKRRIKAGDYVFPDNEWAGVSQDAKDLIKEMLLTTPDKRATIEQILKSRWISNYFAVPQTPLPSLERLKEERDNWVDFQNAYGQTLNEMRVNYDTKVKIKEISDSNNPLIIRRMKKTKTIETTPTTSSATTSAAAAGASANTPESSKTSPNAAANAAAGATAAESSKQSKVPEGGLVVENLLSRDSSMISVDGNTPTNSRPSSPKRMVQ